MNILISNKRLDRWITTLEFVFKHSINFKMGRKSDLDNYIFSAISSVAITRDFLRTVDK